MNELSELILDLFSAVEGHKHVTSLYHSRHDQCFSQESIERRENEYKRSHELIKDIFLSITDKQKESN